MSHLQVEGLSISFGGLRAVHDLSFTVAKSSIFGLIGPNGAGKSTVFNCISRLYQPDSGRITFEGNDLLACQAHELAGLGVGRTFQNIELFDGASLLSNLMTAQFSLSRTGPFSELLYLPPVRRQEVAFRQKAEEMIDFFELAHYRHEIVGRLPYGVRKVAEIARSLCLSPGILLLDEPSSGLNQEETDDLSHQILDIRDRLDTTVLLVDHNMNLIEQVADEIVAMAQGEGITSGPVNEVIRHPEVLRAYLGEDHG